MNIDHPLCYNIHRYEKLNCSYTDSVIYYFKLLVLLSCHSFFIEKLHVYCKVVSLMRLFIVSLVHHSGSKIFEAYYGFPQLSKPNRPA